MLVNIPAPWFAYGWWSRHHQIGKNILSINITTLAHTENIHHHFGKYKQKIQTSSRARLKHASHASLGDQWPDGWQGANTSVSQRAKRRPKEGTYWRNSSFGQWDMAWLHLTIFIQVWLEQGTLKKNKTKTSNTNNYFSCSPCLYKTSNTSKIATTTSMFTCFSAIKWFRTPQITNKSPNMTLITKCLQHPQKITQRKGTLIVTPYTSIYHILP